MRLQFYLRQFQSIFVVKGNNKISRNMSSLALFIPLKIGFSIELRFYL